MLTKKLEKMRTQTEIANHKNKSLNIRQKNLVIRENNYKTRQARYNENIVEMYERETARGRSIVNDIRHMRLKLGEIQKVCSLQISSNENLLVSHLLD